MKILMIGLGSIGQRHVRNIRKLLGDEAELIAYRSRGLKTTFTDTLQIREGISLEEEYGITAYRDLDEALAQKPELAFITNITAKHMECALACAKAGCHLLIEKPLSHSPEGLEELVRVAEEKELVVFMGFQNRYHPCVKRLKEGVESGELGRLSYVACEFSERLTTMHRYEDYRGTYMARKDFGGGPVLNLQMHDLDILRWIFGMPRNVRAQLGMNSGLEIDVEESAQAVFESADGLPVCTHTDFLQYPPVHRFKVVGEKGRIEADLNAVTFKKFIGDDPEQIWSDAGFLRNDMFIEELKDFFAALRGEKPAAIPLQAGIDSLRMALAMKESAAEGRTVEL
ncbi:MAG: Gfo/Idh/MocA family oxidoreductase [Lachnospiraceae bacterium]|nr:Gfo/Idh/MocA family oxidoreductase [Lachnospiraceae bacterium]